MRDPATTAPLVTVMFTARPAAGMCFAWQQRRVVLEDVGLVVLLGEPTSSLDAGAAALLAGALRALIARGGRGL
jgi:hypothetical protein